VKLCEIELSSVELLI